ncbi:MAG TPA: gliding motility-associated C-terminal domain-containing protein [Edaphocola sp.]|nr:gliding motility-associated C-terminal domain-containing protein [Edaphocola sp.]
MKYICHLLASLLMLTGATSAAYAQSTHTNFNQEDGKKAERGIMIPTAFSPNSDGINDIFKLVNVKDEKLIEFRVFNRWGTIMFATNDIHQGWDGTYKGQAQAPGVYGYIIRILYTDGMEEIYRGTVTLVR